MAAQAVETSLARTVTRMLEAFELRDGSFHDVKGSLPSPPPSDPMAVLGRMYLLCIKVALEAQKEGDRRVEDK